MSLADRLRRWFGPSSGTVGASDATTTERPTHGAYDRLARWYDWSGAIAFSDTCVELTLRALRDARLEPRSCLDIACGTGSFLMAMERRGAFAVGVDRSHAMLVEARDKAREQHARLALVCADMREFQLGRRFELVTCFYDALNHLPDTIGVAAAIETAARHAEGGGLYVFDTNNERMFQRVWSGPRETIDVVSGDVEIDYHYDPVRRTGSAQVTFRRRGEPPVTGWVHERCHAARELERALESAGFVLESRGPHPYFADPSESLKDLWIARKR